MQQSSHITLRRRTPPITCTACDVIYLTADPLPASVRTTDWICGGCLVGLLGPETAST
jgi:hypothetical protein